MLFLAGLRAIPAAIYEAAALDNASPWLTFRKITWPLLWPVTALVLTIQLILQLKIFDQVYLFAANVRTDATMVMVQYIVKQAFQMNKGGLAAAASMVLFILIVIFIITAPLLTQAVKLELPKASSQVNDLRPEKIEFAIDAPYPDASEVNQHVYA